MAIMPPRHYYVPSVSISMPIAEFKKLVDAAKSNFDKLFPLREEQYIKQYRITYPPGTWLFIFPKNQVSDEELSLYFKRTMRGDTIFLDEMVEAANTHHDHFVIVKSSDIEWLREIESDHEY